MLRSLVGSEMCIRDSKWTPQTKIMAGILLAAALGGAVFVVYGAYLGQTTVSYTHLTLPTIYSV